MRTKEGQGNDEDRLEREVLALALFEHPVRLTLREAQKALGLPRGIESAVAALVAAGLLGLAGEEFFPTPAAIRFNEIEPVEPPRQA